MRMGGLRKRSPFDDTLRFMIPSLFLRSFFLCLWRGSVICFHITLLSLFRFSISFFSHTHCQIFTLCIFSTISSSSHRLPSLRFYLSHPARHTMVHVLVTAFFPLSHSPNLTSPRFSSIPSSRSPPLHNSRSFRVRTEYPVLFPGLGCFDLSLPHPVPSALGRASNPPCPITHPSFRSVALCHSVSFLLFSSPERALSLPLPAFVQ